MNKPTIIFFGTSHFAVPILNRLADSEFKPVLVITQPDAIAGRKKILMPPPIKEAAKAFGIETIQPEILKTIEAVQKMEALKPDLFILAAYGRIIPENIINIPKSGILNIHPSLLPKFRGASPIHAAILNGEPETGTTIIQMDAEIDHGPIIKQKKIALSGSENYAELQKILSDLSANLLLEILSDYCAGRIKPQAQVHSKATFTRLIKSEDGRVDWTKPAIEINRQIRAYHLWPKACSFWKRPADERSLRINFLKAGIMESPAPRKPGMILSLGRNFGIAAGKDLIVPEIIQLEGKKETDAESFLRGHKDMIGSVLV